MRDVRIVELAGAQFNRVSRTQLEGLGLTSTAIARGLEAGRFVAVEQGVFALPPVLAHDEWGWWMGATLTAPETVLSHEGAGTAWRFWKYESRPVTVTRPGSGGPRRHGGLLAFRSSTLEGDTTTLRGIPITTVPRTLLDLAPRHSPTALARAVREAVRLNLTTTHAIVDCVSRHPGRRGSRRLLTVISRYAGLPLERARSGAEVRALEVLRDGSFVLPRLNVRIAGEEADLSWAAHRLLIEVDGGPFHLDVGEDARKQTRWERARWTVRRISSDDVYDRPERLLALAAAFNVPRCAP
jgi:very-short-patch-repair endonuclease